MAQGFQPLQNCWRAFLKALEGLDDSTKERRDIKHRSKLIVGMLYYLGLRIFELEKSLWSSFYFEDKAWWFFVKGKGGKLAKVPVNKNLLNLINTYRREVGRGALPKGMSDDAPILTFKNKPLSKYSMYKHIKDVAIKAAQSFEEGSLSNEKLKKMSPHWLRHLSASHQDKLGVPATIIKENHRHGSFLTTQIYLHGEDSVRHNEIQKLDAKIDIDDAGSIKKRFKVSIPNAWSKEERVEKFFKSLEAHVLGNAKLIEVVENGLTPSRSYEIDELDIEGIEREAEFRLLDVNICEI